MRLITLLIVLTLAALIIFLFGGCASAPTTPNINNGFLIAGQQ